MADIQEEHNRNPEPSERDEGIGSGNGVSLEKPGINQRLTDLSNDPVTSQAAELAETQLEEARSRRTWRSLIFITLYVFTLFIFITFLFYVWYSIIKCATADHLLIWLLAFLPLAMILIMLKLATEPRRQEDTQPSGTALDLLKDFLEIIREYISQKMGK